MELFDQIRKVSFVFFIVIGLAHFLAGLAYVNGYFLPTSGLVNRVLFIPFVICALSYAFSTFKYYLIECEKDKKWISYALIGVGILVFLGLIAIELLVPDSKTPLIPSA